MMKKILLVLVTVITFAMNGKAQSNSDRLSLGVVGLSLAGLHTLVCYRLFGLVVTLVIVGVQVVIASGIVWIKIRAPD